MKTKTLTKIKVKKPKRYRSVNALLRGMHGAKKAESIIDGMQDQLVRENLMLVTHLVRLVNACSCDSPSTVCIPDRRVVNAARRVARAAGAVMRTPKRG